MADIALGSVVKIIEVGRAINEAVETAQQNKEDCLEIQKRALRVTAILKGLEKTKVMEDPATRDALQDLEETLRNALTLVNACQERHIACLFYKANDLSKKLRRVQDDIERRVMLGVFATNIQVTIILTNIESAPPPTPPQPQNAGASSSDTIVESSCRIEMDIKDNNVIQVESNTPLASSHGFTKFSLSDLMDVRDKFSKDNLIGQGAFGDVYKGALQDGQVVAIKKFNNSSELSYEQMSKELHYISKIKHRNIVKCLGYVHEEVQTTLVEMGKKSIHAEGTHFCLVHEYMTNGDLERINCGTRADWSSRLQLIHGIAQGVCYLHNEQGIVHLDLKPGNILLDSDMNAKITDFGISTIFDASTTNTTRNLKGTMGYMPPEYIFESDISFKTDVYAFGIILLGTIISGMCKGDLQRGWASVEWAREARDKNNRQLRKLFDPSLFDESQLKQIKACLDIGLSCAEMNRKERPCMANVVAELDRIKDGRHK